MQKLIPLIGAVVLLYASAIHSFAIEGLQISIQSSNVVLSWPSVDGSGATFIVQSRHTLDATDSWQTLTSSWPAATGTNITFFVHSNAVEYPSGFEGGGTNGGGVLPPGPMVMLAGRSDAAVPLAIYPPGSDLSGFVILDPATGTRVSGNGHTVKAFLPKGGIEPMDDSAGGSNSVPGTGFYRVVQDGVKILDSTVAILANEILSNNVTVAFEAGNAANDGTGTNVLGDLACATLLIDGAKFAGDGVLGSPTNSPWRFDMDTAYLQNGTHTLQVAVTWLNPDNSNGNNVNITRYSDPVTITVSNVINYPNWEPEIGEMGISAYFLQTVFTNVDWQIDIYDASNDLAQTLVGHTDDGLIEAYWNMMDTNGVTRTNADVDPEFIAIATVYDAPISKKTPKKIQRRKDWPDHGSWVITYQDFFKFEYSANNLMKNSIDNFAYTAAKYGGYYLYYPQPGQTNDIGQTYPLSYQKTNHLDTNITADSIIKDQALLELFLSVTNSRNFYYNGHGSADTIAGGLPASEIQSYVKHRYRFVFLDGCDTANGKWDAAFGIHGPGRFALTYYENTGIRPGAFCGYNIETPYATGGQVTHNGVTYDDTIPDDVPYFIINFLFYWDTDLGNERLIQAINDAGKNLSPVGGWYPGTGLQIYGYDDLRIDECNHGADAW